METKTEASYRKVMERSKIKFPEVRPLTIMTDFEVTLRHVFLKLRYFHVGFTLYRYGITILHILFNYTSSLLHIMITFLISGVCKRISKKWDIQDTLDKTERLKYV
jgi:hypothetical protein